MAGRHSRDPCTKGRVERLLACYHLRIECTTEGSLLGKGHNIWFWAVLEDGCSTKPRIPRGGFETLFTLKTIFTITNLTGVFIDSRD